MFIQYDGVNLDVLALESWRREAVYSDDKTTFLWWHHNIQAVCILNVEATSAARFPPLEFLVPAPPDRPFVDQRPRRGAKPIKPAARPRTDLDFMLKPGQTVEDLLDEGLPVPVPGFHAKFGEGGGPDFGGDFGGAGGPAKPPFIRFDPVRPRKLDAGGRPQFLAAARPALTTTRPTVPHTDVELRARLRRPRRQLLVGLQSGPRGAAEFMLVSPLHPDAQSDAQHGPIVSLLEIPQIHGEVTGVLRVGIETWEAPPLEWTTVSAGGASLVSVVKPLPVDAILKRARNPQSPEARAMAAAIQAYQDALAQSKSPTDAAAAAIEAARGAGAGANAAAAAQAGLEAAGERQGGAAVAGGVAAGDVVNGQKMRQRVLATPALVSHRWEMSFGWNPETHLKTQVISGEAIFRQDVLHMRGLGADQLRGYIWHPIPEGFKRRPVGEDDVKLAAGNDGISYRIVDDQASMNFPGGVEWGCVEVSALSEMEYHGYDMVNPDAAQWHGIKGDHPRE